MMMRAPAGMTSLHSGHEKVDEASGRTVSTQRAHSSWLPSQGMILGSRSSSSKGSRHTGHSRALISDPVSVRAEDARLHPANVFYNFSEGHLPAGLHANFHKGLFHRLLQSHHLRKPRLCNLETNLDEPRAVRPS